MKIFQFLVFFLFVAVGVHGDEKENCDDAAGQLDDRYLKIVFLTSEGDLLDATQNPDLGKTSICSHHFSSPDINHHDAVRIDEHKYVILGYNGHILKEIKIVKCGGGEMDEGAAHPFSSPGIELTETSWNTKAYFQKEGGLEDGYIYVSEEHKVDLKDFSGHNYHLSDIEEKFRTCFKDENRCIYDPYAQKLENKPSKIWSSSCDLRVTKDGTKTKIEDSAGGKNKFCLSEDAKYKKTFLLPDASMYPKGKCDGTMLRSNFQEHQTNAEVAPGGNQDSNDPNFRVQLPDKKCEKNIFWIIFGSMMGVFFIGLVGVIVMIYIERKGKAKKQAYMRFQKMIKKDEPSGNTTMTMTQTQTQDDGGKTQDDNNKSAFNNPQ